MTTRSCLCLLAVLLVSFGAVSPLLAQAPLAVTNPTGSVIWAQGGTYAVSWTGGDPSWQVNVHLVNTVTWAVAGSIALNVPNSGSATYTVPVTIAPGTYLVYVEEVTQLSWVYGEYFPIIEGTVSDEVSTWSLVKGLFR